MDVLLFGGTTEGRLLAEWLNARSTCNVVVCTATSYGADLLPHGEHIQTLVGPLSPAQKKQLMESNDFACVIDATHPYAQHISMSVEHLAQTYSKDLVRVARADCANHATSAQDKKTEPHQTVAADAPTTAGNSSTAGTDYAGLTVVASMEEAARHVAATTGNVLLTTGSKDLPTFCAAVANHKERLYVRVLPTVASLSRVLSQGIPPSHIIAMQGPFSTSLNRALIEDLAIACMVTKESGSVGGFEQKVRAARACGIELVVVGRPPQHSGLSLKAAQELLEDRYGL